MTATDTTAPPAKLPRWKARVFGAIIALGLLACAEALAAIYWLAAVPKVEQESIDALIGEDYAGHASGARYRAHPYFHYTGDPSYVQLDGVSPWNAAGFRAGPGAWVARPANDANVRILSLGGSTTYGFYTSAESAWPARLAADLQSRTGTPIDSLNGGLPNYTTANLIGIAAMLLPDLRPDFVLLHVGFNDAFAIAYPDEGGPDGTLFRRPWREVQVSPLGARVMRASFLARVLGVQALSARDAAAVGDMTSALNQPRPRDEDIAAHVAENDGRHFRQRLETLVLLVKRAGATPVLVTEPMNRAREKGEGAFYGAAFDGARRNVGIMHEVATGAGVPIIDLYALMRDSSLFVDPVHVGDEGMARKSALLAEALAPLLSAQRAPR